MGFFSALFQPGPSTIPLSDTPPGAEAKAAAAGSMPVASRGDHTHPRLTSAANATLDANGYATITFTRTFTTEPVLVFGAIGAGTGPVPDFRGDFIITNGIYTGVTIFGQRSRPLPNMPSQLTALAVLTGVITAVNSIMSLLSGFTPYEPAAGARVSVTAIQAS